MMGRSETLSSSQIQFITLFSAGAQHNVAGPFTSQRKQWNYAAENKTIFLSQPGMFWLFFIQFLLPRITYWAPLEMLLVVVLFVFDIIP